MTGTRLANNPKYGTPSAKKQRRIDSKWSAWRQGMALLRSILVEEQNNLGSKAIANQRLEEVKRYV
jgi:hypothetical protein